LFADAKPPIVADVLPVLLMTDFVVALTKLYVTPTADDAADHVKLIDVASDETAVQLFASVGAKTSQMFQSPIKVNPNKSIS
jgi:hypothetical protein